MLTIDLEPELETILNEIAQQAHCSPTEIVKQLINHHLKQKRASELLTHIINELPTFPSFANQDDPLTLQNALRDEWR